MLPSCRFLRCASICFQEQNFTYSPPNLPKAIFEDVNGLTHEITSNSSVSDPYAKYVDFRQGLLDIHDIYEGDLDDIEDDLEQQYEDLRQCAMDYDESGFGDKVSVLLPAIEAEMRRILERDADQIEDVTGAIAELSSAIELLGWDLERIPIVGMRWTVDSSV